MLSGANYLPGGSKRFGFPHALHPDRIETRGRSRMKKLTFSSIPFLLIVYGLVPAVPAHAYIDPNAQNLLTQALTPLVIIAATGLTFLRKQTRAAIGWLTDRLLRRRI